MHISATSLMNTIPISHTDYATVNNGNAFQGQIV